MPRINGFFLILLLPASVPSQQAPVVRPSAAFMRQLDAGSVLLDRDTVRLYFRRDSIPALGDTIDTRFYGEVLTWYPALREYQQRRGLFAISRIKLGDGVVAYVIRAPSQYSPTAIDIWPFDPRDSILGPPLRVADAFGDGMWYFRMDAWLVDLDADGVRDLVQRRRDWWERDATGEHREADSLFVYRRSAGRFQDRQLSTEQRFRRAFEIPDWTPR